MDKNKLKEISNSLKFNATDVVANQILNIADQLEKDLMLLRSFDTSQVKPMSRIDDTPISFLRDDVEASTLSKSDVLNNASEKDDDFIIINSKRGGADV